jgi:hypothetical protein
MGNRLLSRTLHRMTEGVEMKGVVIKSTLFALLSAFSTIPYFHYLLSFSIESTTLMPDGATGFLAFEIFLVFLITLLSALVGFSFSDRYSLPGLGKPGDLIRSLPILALLGLLMVGVSYFLFDRSFYEISPASYPGYPGFLLTIPLKGALTDEIILRFCLVTIGVGLFKNSGFSVVFISAIASLLTIKYLQFFGIEFSFEYLPVALLVSSFVSNLLLGYLFVTRGLLFSMVLKFFLGFKYVLVALTMGGLG